MKLHARCWRCSKTTTCRGSTNDISSASDASLIILEASVRYSRAIMLGVIAVRCCAAPIMRKENKNTYERQYSAQCESQGATTVGTEAWCDIEVNIDPYWLPANGQKQPGSSGQVRERATLSQCIMYATPSIVHRSTVLAFATSTSLEVIRHLSANCRFRSCNSGVIH